MENFFEVFFSLVNLIAETKDDFLKEKLVKKTKEFFYVAQVGYFGPKKDNVAQYNLEIKKLIGNIEEFIEILVHLKLVSLSPALSAQKNLLKLRLEILEATLPKPKKVELVLNGKNYKDNYSSKKVFAYLKTKPEGAQSFEISNHFKDRLSRRTVQRYLNDLIKEGLLKKDRSSGFPRYIANKQPVDKSLT